MPALARDTDRSAGDPLTGGPPRSDLRLLVRAAALPRRGARGGAVWRPPRRSRRLSGRVPKISGGPQAEGPRGRVEVAVQVSRRPGASARVVGRVQGSRGSAAPGWSGPPRRGRPRRSGSDAPSSGTSLITGGTTGPKKRARSTTGASGIRRRVGRLSSGPRLIGVKGISGSSRTRQGDVLDGIRPQARRASARPGRGGVLRRDRPRGPVQPPCTSSRARVGMGAPPRSWRRSRSAAVAARRAIGVNAGVAFDPLLSDRSLPTWSGDGGARWKTGDRRRS